MYSIRHWADAIRTVGWSPLLFEQTRVRAPVFLHSGYPGCGLDRGLVPYPIAREESQQADCLWQHRKTLPGRRLSALVPTR